MISEGKRERLFDRGFLAYLPSLTFGDSTIPLEASGLRGEWVTWPRAWGRGCWTGIAGGGDWWPTDRTAVAAMDEGERLFDWGFLAYLPSLTCGDSTIPLEASGPRGQASGLRGHASGLRGQATGLRGHAPGVGRMCRLEVVLILVSLESGGLRGAVPRAFGGEWAEGPRGGSRRLR